MPAEVSTTVWRRMRAAGGDFYRSRVRRDVPILMFHRIRDAEGVGEAKLAEILDHCADGYRVITLGDLATLIRRGTRVPNNTVVLTFDDCTRDQFTRAAPALRERGLRATFATIGCTLTERRLPRLYWYFHVIENTTLKSATFGFAPHVTHRDWRLDDTGRREMMHWRSPLLQAVIRSDHSVGEDIVASLGETLGVSPPVVDELFMTLDDLKSLEREGHEVAAHTMQHVDVDRPDRDTWNRELRENFAMMTDLFGARRHSFVFPFGYDRSPSASQRVQDVGFGCAATTEWGTNTRHTDVHSLRRVGVDNDTRVPLATIY